MNNLRSLTGLLSAALSSVGACAYGQSVITLEEIFEVAETGSAQLRPSLTSQTEADQEANVAHSGRLPDINVSLSLSYIGDGFTTDRNFSDYQKAPIPHFGNGLSVNIAAARKVLDEMHARYEQGTALQNDITRYELLVSNLELQLIRNRRTQPELHGDSRPVRRIYLPQGDSGWPARTAGPDTA